MSIVAIPPQLASAHAVLFGRYGDVRRLAQERGVCRQSLYRDTHTLLKTLGDAVPRHLLEPLRQRLEELQAHCRQLEGCLGDA
jgi:hypothetical protein